MRIRLDKLKPYRIYGKRNEDTITTLGAFKNPRKGMMVLPFSMTDDFVLDVFNSNLLERQYFRDIYVPQQVQIGGRVVRNTKRNEYYRYLRSQTNQFNTYHHNLNMIMGKNIVIDNVESLKIFNKVSIQSGKFKSRSLIELLGSQASSFDYSDYVMKNPLIVVDASDVIQGHFNPNQYFNVNTGDPKNITPLRAFVHFIKESVRNVHSVSPNVKILLNSTFVMYSSVTGSFFMTKLDNTFNYNRFIQRLRTLLKENFTYGKKTLSKSVMEVEGLAPEEAFSLDSKGNDTDGMDKKEELIAKGKMDGASKSKIEISSKISEKLLGELIQAFDLDPKEKNDSELIQYLEDTIDDSLSNIKSFTSQKSVLEQLSKDRGLKLTLYDVKTSKLNAQPLDEVKVMRSKLTEAELNDKLSLDGISIKDLLDDFEAKKIKNEVMPIKNAPFDTVKTSTLKDLDANYNKYQSDSDLTAILSSFEDDPDLPMKLHSVERVDTSDSFNKKDTLTAKFKDVDGKIHSITIDVPTFVEDRFLYLNGSRNTIVKQMVMKPIVKVDTDTAKVTTNYNILHIKRFGAKVDTNTNIITKAFTTKSEKRRIDLAKNGIVLGDSGKIASKYVLPVELNEFAKNISIIKMKDYKLNFNIDTTMKLMEENATSADLLNNYVPFTEISNGKMLVTHKSTGGVFEVSLESGEMEKISDSIALYIYDNANDEIKSALDATAPPKRLAYSRVRILSRNLPLAIILAQRFGLQHMLNRYMKEGEDFIIIKKGESGARSMNKMLWDPIRFADGTLFISKKKSRFLLLLNGLKEMNTRLYTFEEMEAKSPYMEYLDEYHGSQNIIKGVNASLDLIIDPITESVLDDLNLPTDIFDVLLYCNTLIEDTYKTKANDMENFRIRSNEIINAHIYKTVANAYKSYKEKHASNVSPNKMSLPKNVIIRNLQEDPLVNNYSTLNPYLEAQELGAVTFRGIAGINMGKAIGTDMRAFDKSFDGILALSTPDSDKVGVVRQLTYDPKIVNTRGVVSIDKSNAKDLDASNMLTPVELLSPFTNTHDDPQRAQMMSVQSKVFALYKPY